MSDAVMLAEMYVELLAMERAGLMKRERRPDGQVGFVLTDLGRECDDALDSSARDDEV